MTVSSPLRWVLVIAALCLSGMLTGWASSLPIEAWSQRAQITVSGYAPPGGETPLTNFPCLVKLGNQIGGFNYGRFLSGSNADLRFVDGTSAIELPYEIESWDTNGTSWVWVQMPVLTNNASLTALWGRTGQSSPAYTTNGTVWDGDFVGVWHMAQTDARDSTSNRFNGTAYGSVTQVPAGIAGGANAFSASTDYVQVPDSARFTFGALPFTVSAWINIAATNTYAAALGTYGAPGFILAVTNSVNRFLCFYDGTWRSSTVSIPTGTWKQVAYTRSGSTGTFYVDGLAVKTVTGVAAGPNGGPLRFGQGGTNWAQPLLGRVDEVALSTVDRSANWMWASYMNLASNADFATVSGAVGPAHDLQNKPASTVSTTSATLCGELLWDGGIDVIATVYWGLSDGGTNAPNWEHTNQLAGLQAVGQLSTNLTGLSSNATYYYTYCVSNASGVTWAAPSETFITGEIWIEKTSDASEIGLTPGTFTVYRAITTTNEALSIAYAQTGGTAVEGINYDPLPGTVTLPAGSTNGWIVVTPRIDYVNTTPTTLQLTLTGGPAPIGSPDTAAMSIANETLVNVWIRSDTNASAAKASVNTNWSKGHSPLDGEIVYLGSNSVLDLTWDLTNGTPIVPSAWAQDTAYTGTVTIPTKYPSQGTFTNFLIAGDCLLAGGTWTHPANSGGATAKDKLAVTVNGNLTLGTGAVINVTGRGFASAAGPGAGTTGQRNSAVKAASHGGVGGVALGGTVGNCYGSATAPDTLGSGANDRGGGAVRLVVAGTATIDGTIQADGIYAGSNPTMRGGNAGGSIYVKAGRVTGSGQLRASGGSGYASGGGGRVALIATNATSLGNVTYAASGPAPVASGRGGAGTIYLETTANGPGAGRVIIDSPAAAYNTELPPALSPDMTNEFSLISLIVTNSSTVYLTSSLSIADFANLAANATLNLMGYTLTIAAVEHELGAGTVTTNGGAIIWMGIPYTVGITNLSATNLTATSATLSGELAASGVTTADVTLYWGVSDGSTNARWDHTNRFLTALSSGHISTNLSGLVSNTVYYYTYYASNAIGSAWATPSASFITSELWIDKASDASEIGLIPGTLTVHRASVATNEDLTVSYQQTGGSAVPGVNYVPLSGSVVLTAGLDSAPIVVVPIKEWTNQTDQTLQISLTAAPAPIGSSSNVTLTIANESAPVWPTNVWVRADTNAGAAKASVSTNWSLGRAPTNGETVYLGHYSVLDMTWDLTNAPPVVPGAWVQTTQYTGSVTIPTKYADQGAFTNFEIAGNCMLEGGTWTHPANTGGSTAKDRLAVTIRGNFTLSTGATINVTGRGFAALAGPGAGTQGQRNGPTMAAGHGGVGGVAIGATPGHCYGSATAPDTLGSGANDRGGGAVRLIVAGTASIDGTIEADGIYAGTNPNLRGGNAGGSIFMMAGSVAGSGHLQASGGTGYSSGGGGRVALIVTNSTTLGGLSFAAAGPAPVASGRGGAGTIYLETAAHGSGSGQIIIDNRGGVGYDTELPPTLSPEETNEFALASLLITNKSTVYLTSHLYVADFIGIASGATLDLMGYNLYISADEHALGAGTINTNGGNIVWPGVQAYFDLTVSSGPHGTATTQLSGSYPQYSNVVVSATPDPGYGFYRWEGDIPDSQATNSTATVVMDTKRDLRALFASSDPAMRTWLGFTSSYATNPANWYQNQLPASGDTVILDGTSATNLIWGLNVALASWRQETGYLGTVTIQTRYPGQGTFTNFLVTGDCLIDGGTLTHPANTGGATPTDRLALTVGGNFTLGPDAVVDLTSRGYASQSGPGAGNSVQRSSTTGGRAASHGGRGGIGLDPVTPAATYDSVMAPTNHGSGAHLCAGGGTLDLRVIGTATLNGTIDADGSTYTTLYPGSSGGAISITAGGMSGTGLVTAIGGNGYESGGGGRIAIILTDSDSFGSVRAAAYGGGTAALSIGAAGTVYQQTRSQGPGSGTLTINNNGYATLTNVYTGINDAGDLSGLTMVVTNRGQAGLTADQWLHDLYIRTNTPARLHLDGFTLTLTATYHGDWGDPNWVVYSGGRIVWPRIGSVYKIH